MQKRRNSTVLTVELRLFCIKPFQNFRIDLWNGLMQTRRNFTANTLELRLFCIEPSKPTTCLLTHLLQRLEYSRTNSVPCFGASKNSFRPPYFLIGLWRDVLIGLLKLTWFMRGNKLYFGFHTKYVKYEWFWHSAMPADSNFTDDKLTPTQVMVGVIGQTSHYLKQPGPSNPGNAIWQCESDPTLDWAMGHGTKPFANHHQ